MLQLIRNKPIIRLRSDTYWRQGRELPTGQSRAETSWQRGVE